MWRGTKNLEERRRDWSARSGRETHADALTGNGERHHEAASGQRRDAVAVRRDSVDVDFRDLSTGLFRRCTAGVVAEARSAKADQLTFRSSTSKTSVAFGGMTPPAPCAPYPRSGGIVSVRWPPTFIPATP